MAILIPSREIIEKQRVKPTQGEYSLLNFLEHSLNEEYEIYYQPYLNGKNPDIVLMRKGGGVLIIEVKDWNLAHYYIDKNDIWRLKENNARVISPFDQSIVYKHKMERINSRFIYENILNEKAYAIIKTAVYFHNASRGEILEFINEHNYNEHIEIIARDDINENYLYGLLERLYISRSSRLFNDDLYKSIKRYLKPTFHQSEISQEIFYTSEQMKLVVSEQGKRQKIKGSAGSGKTLVLAKRAVNAHMHTRDRVLILTFNISLINYIHDQISKVKETFAWNNFHIYNYHSFFREYSELYNLHIRNNNDYDNTTFFEGIKSDIHRFKTILIDEIQDYKQEWLNLIINYFSDENTEIVVFGDEKQNIYDRELDDNKEIKITSIVGAWNRSLKKSFRFQHEIGELAIDFQKEFLEKKYGTNEMLIDQQELDFESSIIEYYEIDDINLIGKIIFDFIEKHEIHSNDVAILGDKITAVREVDYQIRHSTGEDTMITFETKEEYNGLLASERDINLIKQNLEKIRRAKKSGFWLNAGMIKISTVHSFKGWEIHTVFLLIDKNSTDELIYTGITRARKNIVIINFGNPKYANFFKKNIKLD